MRLRIWGLALAVATAGCGEANEAEGPTFRDDPPGTRYEAQGTVLESPQHGPQLCLGGVMESLPPQCGGPDITGWDWANVPFAGSANGTTWAEVHVVGTWDGTRFALTEKPGPRRPPAAAQPGHDDFEPGCENPSGDPTVRGELPDLGNLDRVVSAIWVTDSTTAEDNNPVVFTVVVRPGNAVEVERRIRAGYAGALCVVERNAPTKDELAQISEEVGQADDELPGLLSWGVWETRGVVSVRVILATSEMRAYAAKRWGDKVELDSALKRAEG